MFVDHIFAGDDKRIPEPSSQKLYEYVVGSNGAFVQASRPGLSARIPVSCASGMRGLARITPFVKLDNRMPGWMLEKMLIRAYRENGKEILFYARGDPWRISIPEQVQSAGSVTPVNPYASGSETILEVHSHHNMAAYFSRTDDREERAGFRLYAVIGHLNWGRPEILVRVGIYGHFWEIPANLVFEMPWFVADVCAMNCMEGV